MIGDAPDFTARLRAQIPAGWFAAAAPRLGDLLGGLSAAWQAIYGQLAVTQTQARLASVNGSFLDLACSDYMARKVARRLAETDTQLRARLLPVLRDKVTRSALVSRLTLLTGNAPVIKEPARPADVGGYGVACGYGVGIYGSVGMPFQFFVTVQRPIGQGIPAVAGYGIVTGGYGIGAIAYSRIEDALPHVTDQDINAAILDTLPLGATAWTVLTGAAPPS